VHVSESDSDCTRAVTGYVAVEFRLSHGDSSGQNGPYPPLSACFEIETETAYSTFFSTASSISADDDVEPGGCVSQCSGLAGSCSDG
jgi:hypothetical protein